MASSAAFGNSAADIEMTNSSLPGGRTYSGVLVTIYSIAWKAMERER